MRCPTKGSQCLRSKKLFIHCIYIAMQATELPIALLGKSTKGWYSLNCTKSAPSRSWDMIFYPMLFFLGSAWFWISSWLPCVRRKCMDISWYVMRLSSKALIAGFFPSCGGSFQILKNGEPLHDFYPTTIWDLSIVAVPQWSIPDLAYSRIDLGTFTFHRRWGCTNSLWCRFGRKKNMQTNLKFPGTRR